MKDSTFAPETTTINFSVDGEKITMTDGQHRLLALCEIGKSYDFPIIATKTDANKIYPKTDRGSARNLYNAIVSFRIPERLETTKANARAAATGLKVVMNGHTLRSYAKVSEDNLLTTLVNDYKEEVARIFSILYSLEFGRKMSGKTPMSLWLTLYKELPKSEWGLIDDFIYGCATHDKLGEDDPRRWVYLMYARYARKGSNTNVIGLTISNLDEIKMLLTAWNFWYHGRKSKKSFQVRTMNSMFLSSPNVTGTNKSYSVSN
jgi:hypothetical protein